MKQLRQVGFRRIVVPGMILNPIDPDQIVLSIQEQRMDTDREAVARLETGLLPISTAHTILILGISSLANSTATVTPTSPIPFIATFSKSLLKQATSSPSPFFQSPNSSCEHVILNNHKLTLNGVQIISDDINKSCELSLLKREQANFVYDLSN